jgi:hypothetical protein
MYFEGQAAKTKPATSPNSIFEETVNLTSFSSSLAAGKAKERFFTHGPPVFIFPIRFQGQIGRQFGPVTNDYHKQLKQNDFNNTGRVLDSHICKC